MGAYTHFGPLYSVLNTLMEVCSSLNIYQSGAFEVGYNTHSGYVHMYWQHILLLHVYPMCIHVHTVQVIKKCPDVLSVLRSIALSVRTYGTRQKKVSGKVHGRDSEASCPTRTTTQCFYT